MAKPRMAGDKLNEPTKESADAREALSRSEQNKQTREEIGNDPERMSQRISGVDREAYDFGGYTDKEINMAMQGESFGDKDYARLTGESLGDEPDAPIEVKPDVPAPVIDGPKPGPGKPYVPGRPDFQGIYPGGGQNINQDNDITSNVTGDNNNVTNTQDNSINRFGSYGTADRAKSLRDKYVLDLAGAGRS
tara:strand:- start:335 stop:910 length:576 start_codon:yes stop_codon:yes gene_type:complete